MKPVLNEELISFFAMVSLGVLIGVVFDALRAARKVMIKRRFFVNLTDIIFWVVVFFLTILTLYLFCDGELRFFLVISAFLSMILYFLTISKGVKYIFSKILEIFLAFFKFIFKILLTPFKFLYKILLIRAFRKIDKFIDKFRKREVVKNEENSCSNGFINRCILACKRHRTATGNNKKQRKNPKFEYKNRRATGNKRRNKRHDG